MGIFSYGQMGIGTSTPRGALDINQPTTNDAGLVLPTNSNVANIVNPQTNGTPAPGTIMYDSTQDCVRLYKEDNTWSGCIGERNTSSGGGSGRGLYMGTTHTSEYNTVPSGMWLIDLLNRTKFGPNGVVKNPISFLTIWGNSVTPGYGSNVSGGATIELMDSGEEIYSKFNILHIGQHNNTAFRDGNLATQQRGLELADKLKSYVNQGGVLFISLNQSNAQSPNGRWTLVESLFREYVGKQLNLTAYATRLSQQQNVRITDNAVNNGSFGDQRTLNYYIGSNVPPSGIQINYGPLFVSDLPAGSEVYMVDTRNQPVFENQEPLVFATGPNNRVIFYYSDDITNSVGHPSESYRTIFLNNLMAYVISKTN